MEKDNQEYLILKSIHDGEETIRQRDIAKIANISLGMTNAIIRRLVNKGFLKAKHINRRSLSYLLTPEGLNIITKRSSDFLKRTIKNVVVFKDTIDIIVAELKSTNYRTINLIGESDLLFLIENSCLNYNIKLIQNEKELDEKQIKNIYSEKFLPKHDSDSLYLVEKLNEVTIDILEYDS